MNDDIEDIIYNDLDYAMDDSFHQEQEEKYQKFSHDEIYHDNGVKIAACAEDLNFYIKTNKYTIYWYISPCDILQIFNNEKLVFEIKKPFNISYFADVKDPLASPGKLEIIYSSKEFVNNKIEKLVPFL